MKATPKQESRALSPPAVFTRTLVGVDGSAESLESVRQAAALLEDGGRLSLVAVYDVAPALVGGTGAAVPAYLDEDVQRKAAEQAIGKAEEALGESAPAETHVVRGTPWRELLEGAGSERSTVIVVGSHGAGRMRGIVVGSTATELVHKAPCSVLIARPAGDDFPRRIAVGVDGSDESAAAYAVARALAERTGAELWPVVAQGGKGVEKARVDAIVDYHREESPDDPVQALVAASADSDLVVIGSRGLHGLKSLGSVSERVAHQAKASVLVVRGTGDGAPGG